MLLTAPAHAQVTYMFYPKISIEAPGTHYSEMSLAGVHNKTTAGISAGLELISSPILYNVSLGGGLSYQFTRKLDTDNYQGFRFITVYGIAKYKCATFMGVECSIIGNVGYNGNFLAAGHYAENYTVNDEDLSYALLGGVYYAGGVRFDKDIFFFEAAYKNFDGTASSTTFRYDAIVHYRTVSFSIGIMI